MTERSFPFASDNGDRVYGSLDFRSFQWNSVGNGRFDMHTEEGIDIAARDGLQITQNILNTNSVDVSPGGCVVNGAGYTSDEIRTLNNVLPTGTTIETWYVLATIDSELNRYIAITLEKTIEDIRKSFILATITANSSGITNIINSTDVAYLRNISNEIESIKYYSTPELALNAPSNVFALCPGDDGEMPDIIEHDPIYESEKDTIAFLDDLATVAKSGSWNDLIDAPVISDSGEPVDSSFEQLLTAIEALPDSDSGPGKGGNVLIPFTLLVANWDINGYYTVTNQDLGIDIETENIMWLVPCIDPTASAFQKSSFISATIWTDSQDIGTLILKYNETKPTTDIPIYIQQIMFI